VANVAARRIVIERFFYMADLTAISMLRSAQKLNVSPRIMRCAGKRISKISPPNIKYACTEH
jgi:hypothetical protein